jgi:hypothetical protein
MIDEKKSCSHAVKIKKKRAVKFTSEQNDIRRTTISDELSQKELKMKFKDE